MLFILSIFTQSNSIAQTSSEINKTLITQELEAFSFKILYLLHASSHKHTTMIPSLAYLYSFLFKRCVCKLEFLLIDDAPSWFLLVWASHHIWYFFNMHTYIIKLCGVLCTYVPWLGEICALLDLPLFFHMYFFKLDLYIERFFLMESYTSIYSYFKLSISCGWH